MAIEIDGSIHQLEEVKRNDEERQRYLESLGIQFLRFTNEQVSKELDIVIKQIQDRINMISDSQSNAGRPSPLGVGGSEGFIIPAIDLIDGKCVRLTQGDYAQKKIYNENPLEVALQFQDIGITRLHLVDLDGAKKGQVVNLAVLEKLAANTKLTIDFGGGIKTDNDLKQVFDTGAAIATIGSIAVKNPELFFKWVDEYGAEKILLGADVKEEKIAVGGWLETTDVSVFDFIKNNIAKGVKNIFCTDIAKDGLLQGPSTDLYKKIIAQFPQLNLIASGGVTTIDDLKQLKTAGCKGAIVGKAIYEGRITMKELMHFN